MCSFATIVWLCLCLSLALAGPMKKIEKKSIPEVKAIEPANQKLDQEPAKFADIAPLEDAAGETVDRAKKQASTTFCLQIRQNQQKPVECTETQMKQNARSTSQPEPITEPPLNDISYNTRDACNFSSKYHTQCNTYQIHTETPNYNPAYTYGQGWLNWPNNGPIFRSADVQFRSNPYSEVDSTDVYSRSKYLDPVSPRSPMVPPNHQNLCPRHHLMLQQPCTCSLLGRAEGTATIALPVPKSNDAGESSVMNLDDTSGKNHIALGIQRQNQPMCQHVMNPILHTLQGVMVSPVNTVQLLPPMKITSHTPMNQNMYGVMPAVYKSGNNCLKSEAHAAAAAKEQDHEHERHEKVKPRQTGGQTEDEKRITRFIMEEKDENSNKLDN